MATDVIARSLAAKALQGGGTGGDVSKEYVDSNLEKKVDKAQGSSANPRIYGVDESGNQTTYFATQTPNANTIPLRDASGRFQVADGVAPKQAVNKGQLDALGTTIDEKIAGVAMLSEQNTFTDLNTFKEATQFDKGLESDDNIVITNAALKVMSNTENGDGTQNDHVAQYKATGIRLEENGNAYDLELPQKSGTIATLADVAGGDIPFQYSEFVTESVLGTKEDGWRLTDDDADIAIYHRNTISQTGMTISKSHIGLQATEDVEEGTNAAVVAMSSDIVSMYINAADGTSSTNLTLDKDGAKLNDVKIATATDLEGKLNVLEESAVNQVYAKTQNGNEGISYTYSAEGGTIAQRSAAGTLAVEDPTQEQDAANKKYVDKACAAIPSGVEITNVPGATAGVVAENDFIKLTSNPNEYITKEGKKYNLSSDRSTQDSYTYVYNGYLNNRDLQESIEITVSSRSWVLNAAKLLTDKTFANGQLGGISIKSDSSDGLEVSNVDGNLSIYGALDADIAGRASKRPITTVNLNKAVLAALTDTEKITPTPEQVTSFKGTWSIKDSTDTKTTSIDNSSTDDQYPSAKAVYDFVGSEITDSLKNVVDITSNQEITGTKTFSGNTLKVQSVDNASDYAMYNSNQVYIVNNTDKTITSYNSDKISFTPDVDAANTYFYSFPSKSGTIALTSDISSSSASQVVVLDPDAAQNGTLTQDQFDILQNDSTARIELNNEYYVLMDDDHTPGVISYTHSGWNGDAPQDKSINITKNTKAWTLVTGCSTYYKHYIQLEVGGKGIYYNFSSTQSTAYTNDTLPAMPIEAMATFVIIANGYYSTVSGLIYRAAADNSLKAILHGLYTTNGTTMTYLTENGADVTFISDSPVKL